MPVTEQTAQADNTARTISAHGAHHNATQGQAGNAADTLANMVSDASHLQQTFSEQASDILLAQQLNTQLTQIKALHAQQPVPSVALRQQRLDTCIRLLKDNQQALCDAVAADFGHRPDCVTRISELYISLQSLKFVRRHIRQWMKPQPRRALFPMSLFGARAQVEYLPKGIVGIMSPWNVPVNAIFGPLADVLGAGNLALIKPSEFTSHTAALLQQLFARYFPAGEVQLVMGGSQTGRVFSTLALDHLIFTGSMAVGKQVMAAAASQLTPVTLELGGKNPVIIAPDANLRDSAEKIIAAKGLNSGQICLSPDECWLPADKLAQFIEHCRHVAASLYPTVVANADVVPVMGMRHSDRITALLDNAAQLGAEVINLDPTGNDWRSGEANSAGGRNIPLHLVINPPAHAAVLADEIFGPILCVRTYQHSDEVIKAIAVRPAPLALYCFGRDTRQWHAITSQLPSGALGINDIAVHYACDDLPFGGAGHSGMGRYHGREGFISFSHQRAVFRQGWLNLAKLGGTLPPYGDKIAKLSRNLLK
ncbi:aldehyde dehydrogenase [Shewanella sp. NFH-SH190041]|uniref:aldehyde dehydrogenase family protein n=1 Tax=Shewanella sp. NFH-SH190041 TaxID=2950245 RepID=UPI0021C30991|nr:aldehyde dehydrogenase family protein [Shewanella sp. NFH-SH190041]BDM64398.1 aldehyde dehydrogenase [Shewanella sp. NFH-SH190041]